MRSIANMQKNKDAAQALVPGLVDMCDGLDETEIYAQVFDSSEWEFLGREPTEDERNLAWGMVLGFYDRYEE